MVEVKTIASIKKISRTNGRPTATITIEVPSDKVGLVPMGECILIIEEVQTTLI